MTAVEVETNKGCFSFRVLCTSQHLIRFPYTEHYYTTVSMHCRDINNVFPADYTILYRLLCGSIPDSAERRSNGCCYVRLVTPRADLQHCTVAYVVLHIRLHRYTGLYWQHIQPCDTEIFLTTTHCSVHRESLAYSLRNSISD